MRLAPKLVLPFVVAVALAPTVAAQNPGEVASFRKIAVSTGFGPGGPGFGDTFGHAVAYLGDVDGDGVGDIAIGESRDDDAGFDAGAIWICFLNLDGSVKAQRKITTGQGGFTGVLTTQAEFGSALVSMGDLDGDGVTDLAAGTFRDDDGGTDRGAVWILFLKSDGTVKAHQKISDTQGGFIGVLANGDGFGISVANMGDRDGDGVQDLAVGARFTDDGGANRGAVWICRLNPNGTVKGFAEKISQTSGNFTGTLANDDVFGSGVAGIADVDGDGVNDLAVGAMQDDDGGANGGAVWILFLNAHGGFNPPVKGQQKISATQGGLNATLAGTNFGSTVTAFGDYDGDGVGDIGVGARLDGAGAPGGTLWILLLKSDGTVKAAYPINETSGNFSGVLSSGDEFANSISTMGDHDGDGKNDLLVGSWLEDDSSTNDGAAYILRMSLSCPGTAVEYGDGCPGSGAFVPRLLPITCPVAGGQQVLRIDRALGSSVVAILFGVNQAALPIGASGCFLNVAPIVGPSLVVPLGGAGPGNGTLTLSGVVPPSAVGLTARMQAFVQDPVGLAGFVTTNGLELQY
ncbi:MAG: integrin alpha [Planctomycetota bacterium JB042]